MKKAFLLTTALALSAAVAGPAIAQEAPQPRANNTVGDVVITAERRTQSVQSSSLAIQVLSAQALSDAGVSQVRDITAVAPGVQIGQGGPATQVFVRGVGDFGSTPVTNPAVATNIDGVYVARANAIEGNFFDIQRLEVLKGPQGTLYGRNAAGGALNILTNPPVLGELGGRVNVEIGNYNLVNADGAINVPIGDDLAVRAAFQSVSRDGYSSMGFDDDRKQAGRLGVLWRPNDDFSLKFGAAWAHIGGIGPSYNIDTLLQPSAVAALAQLGITVPTDPRVSSTDPRASNVLWGLQALQGLRAGPYAGGAAAGWGNFGTFCIRESTLATARLNGVAVPPGSLVTPPGLCNQVAALFPHTDTPGTGNYVATTNPPLYQSNAKQDNINWNAQFEMNWNMGFANLTVLPAFRRTESDYTTFPGGPYRNGGREPETSEMRSLETRLANDTDLVDWVVGLYFFTERQNQFLGAPLMTDTAGINANTYSTTQIFTENRAAFGQATWHLSDALRLITGLRYSEETKFLEFWNFRSYPNVGFVNITGASTPTACGLGGPDCFSGHVRGERDFHALNYKAGLEYDIGPANMLFFTVATGFKSGGLNTASAAGAGTVAVPGPANGYDPENLLAYELGSRNRFMDGRLQVNVEAFYWQYDAHQELAGAAIINPLTGLSTAVTGIQNVGDAEVYGADFDVVWRATDHDTLRFNTEYLHTEYVKSQYLQTHGVQGFTTDCPVTPVPSLGVFSLNCTGKPLARSPEWSGSMSWTHTWDLASGATIDAMLSGQYATERYLGTFYQPENLAEGYFMSNLNVTYRSADGDWSLSAFGRNLNDAEVFTGSFGAPLLINRNIGAPRTYGVKLGVNF